MQIFRLQYLSNTALQLVIPQFKCLVLIKLNSIAVFEQYCLAVCYTSIFGTKLNSIAVFEEYCLAVGYASIFGTKLNSIAVFEQYCLAVGYASMQIVVAGTQHEAQ